ncbi:MAG TPA: branched-chain amino acid ABC transporter permease [Gaiellaceae bacterium]|jgi:branched-chain amino acid transport system permease protein|nr:branched-chain amino acid ABC transporter permease [Gaiellaceae bacterium]
MTVAKPTLEIPRSPLHRLPGGSQVIVAAFLLAGCVFLAIGSARSALFAQETVSGLASGGIYASLAVALVLIYRATEVVNFSQGAIATFTTYVAWQLMQWGISYWPAFVLTLALAFVGGIALERVAIRPVERASQLTVVIVSIGLLIAIEGAVGWIWSSQIRFMPSAFPIHPIHLGGVSFSLEDVGTIGVTIGAVVLLWAFFRFTKIGLAMRASATHPDAARLVGVRVSWMLALGWGFAAVLGAVSGMLAAASPSVLLQPSMMDGVLIYAFAAAVLGGLESPAGAVVGGLAIGVTLNLLASYVGFVTPQLLLPAAFVLMLGILLIKPSGLFGRPKVRKV